MQNYHCYSKKKLLFDDIKNCQENELTHLIVSSFAPCLLMFLDFSCFLCFFFQSHNMLINPLSLTAQSKLSQGFEVRGLDNDGRLRRTPTSQSQNIFGTRSYHTKSQLGQIKESNQSF